MYKSPIEIIYGQMQTQMEGDIYRAVQNYGINVDKEELLRALQYDREQYEKGYADGKAAQEWISVKDRLPDGECLAVSMLTGPAYKEMLIGWVGEASNWDTGYECESDGEILPNVTHWMPLPQPPKGE